MATKEKKTLKVSEAKKVIKKLKKLRDKIRDEKVLIEKDVKKLKKKKAKKNKIKLLKERINQLLKKEKKVVSDLKDKKKDHKKNESKSVRVKKKDEPKKKDSAKTAETKVAKSTTTITIEEDQLPVIESEPSSENSEEVAFVEDNQLMTSSSDQSAKQAITNVRQLTDLMEIDRFLIGETRSTVVKAGEARKRKLTSDMK